MIILCGKTEKKAVGIDRRYSVIFVNGDREEMDKNLDWQRYMHGLASIIWSLR